MSLPTEHSLYATIKNKLYRTDIRIHDHWLDNRWSEKLPEIVLVNNKRLNNELAAQNPSTYRYVERQAWGFLPNWSSKVKVFALNFQFFKCFISCCLCILYIENKYNRRDRKHCKKEKQTPYILESICVSRIGILHSAWEGTEEELPWEHSLNVHFSFLR